MYNNDNGCGMAGCGWLILVFLLFGFGAWGNGNGFGGWGGNNGNLATATETASLVQQDNMRSQVADIATTVRLGQQFNAGIADGVKQVQDNQIRLSTDLCQLANNFSNQVSQLQYNNQQQFCALNQAIVDNRLAIEGKLSEYRMEDLKEKLDASKEAYNNLKLDCSQNAQTNAIVNAINARPCQPPPAPACGGYGYGAPYGAGACAPCGPSNYELQSLAALRTIADAAQATNVTLAQQTTTLNNLTTTLAAVETRVNQIPTT